MDRVDYETYNSNEVYDNMDLNPTENQVISVALPRNQLITVHCKSNILLKKNAYTLYIQKIISVHIKAPEAKSLLSLKTKQKGSKRKAGGFTLTYT